MMNVERLSRKAGLVGTFFAILVSFGLIAGGVLFAVMPRGEYGETVGTVVEIRTEWIGGEAQRTVDVEYTVDGVHYPPTDLHAYDSRWVKGDEITIRYLLSDPTKIEAPMAEFIAYIVIAFGVIALAVTVIRFARLKKWERETAESEAAFASAETGTAFAAGETASDAPEGNGEFREYRFRYEKIDGKTGYVLENDAGTPVYECVMVAHPLFRPYTYDFTDIEKNKTQTLEISHSVSAYVTERDRQFDYNFRLGMAYRIDGVSNWEYLGSRGYGLHLYREGLMPWFVLLHEGRKIAEIRYGNVLRGTLQVAAEPGNEEALFFALFSIRNAVTQDDLYRYN